MKLEQILFALSVRHEAAERPIELARFAFMQWLGTLEGAASFEAQARVARARIGAPDSLALAEFLRLLEAALDDPFAILPLAMPVPVRRGGRKRLRL